MSAFSFMPIATMTERTRIEPGHYKATLTAVRKPELYRAYNRWYLRIDFTIHETGEAVPKYVSLGSGKEHNLQLTPKTSYFKLWTLAVGRRPEKNEPMDPARMIGVEFLVEVADRQHEDGELYSRVKDVKRGTVATEPTEATTSTGSTSPTSTTITTSTTVTTSTQLPSTTQDHETGNLADRPSGDEPEQKGKAPQVAMDQRETGQSTPPSVPLTPCPNAVPDAPLTAEQERAKRVAWAAEQKAKNRAEIREAADRRRAAHPELYESEPLAA